MEARLIASFQVWLYASRSHSHQGDCRARDDRPLAGLLSRVVELISSKSNKQIVDSYIRGVCNGAITAGRVVRATVQRHMDDISRQRNDDYPYEFDEHAAERACMFFPLAVKHSTGEWAGNPFEPADWQLFIIWCLFGWKQKSDGCRRFRKCYITLARKNGKSFLASAIALVLLLCDSEQGAQIYIGATKHEQACIVHGEAERMIRSSSSKLLRDQCEIHKNNISVPRTNSFMRPVSSDKPYDGLGPHGVIFDELHAYREVHRPFYETMVSGSASRRQPLEVIITTAGNEKSLIWKEEDSHVTKIVTGVIDDDRVFGFVARLDEDDDPFDESVWQKANPNLGVSVKLDYLREKARDAQHKATALNVFLRYHCNVEVTSVEQAMTRELWDSAKGDLSNWTEADCIGAGFDIGGRDDLAGAAMCARFECGKDDGDNQIWRYEFRARGYLSTGTSRDLTQEPFAGWLHNEQLTKVAHVIPKLRDDLLEDCRDVGCQSVAFDPHNARQCGDEMEEAGMNAVVMPQSCAHFNEPIRELLSALKDGRIRHNGDPVLRWCMLNMAIKQNPRGEWMPDKSQSQEKIDVAVAAIMAFRMAMFGESRPKSKPYSGGDTGVWS